jgi:hypothetical protein
MIMIKITVKFRAKFEYALQGLIPLITYTPDYLIPVVKSRLSVRLDVQILAKGREKPRVRIKVGKYYIYSYS